MGGSSNRSHKLRLRPLLLSERECSPRRAGNRACETGSTGHLVKLTGNPLSVILRHAPSSPVLLPIKHQLRLSSTYVWTCPKCPVSEQDFSGQSIQCEELFVFSREFVRTHGVPIFLRNSLTLLIFEANYSTRSSLKCYRLLKLSIGVCVLVIFLRGPFAAHGGRTKCLSPRGPRHENRNLPYHIMSRGTLYGTGARLLGIDHIVDTVP